MIGAVQPLCFSCHGLQLRLDPMRTYTIVVEPEEGGGYYVTVPALPVASPAEARSMSAASGLWRQSRYISPACKPTANLSPKRPRDRNCWQ